MLKTLLLITLLLAGENVFADASTTNGKDPTPARQALTKIPGWGKKTLRQNFLRFQRLPPKKQAKLKRLFRKFKKLSPEKKRLLLEKYRRFQHLPPGKRKRFRQRFKNMTARQKRKFLLGE